MNSWTSSTTRHASSQGRYQAISGHSDRAAILNLARQPSFNRTSDLLSEVTLRLLAPYGFLHRAAASALRCLTEQFPCR